MLEQIQRSCRDDLKTKDKTKAAIASSLSAKTYSLEIIKKNIENEKVILRDFW